MHQSDIVAAPHRPLVHEARTMLEVEAGVRDPAVYASTLAAMAGGATRTGEIAARLGRATDAVSHNLRAMQAVGLVARRDDALRPGRPTWVVADALLRTYTALFRSRWALVEAADPDRLAAAVAGPWRAQVLHRTVHEVDVVARGEGGRLLALGEAKLRAMGEGDVERLRRVRDLLVRRGDATFHHTTAAGQRRGGRSRRRGARRRDHPGHRAHARPPVTPLRPTAPRRRAPGL